MANTGQYDSQTNIETEDYEREILVRPEAAVIYGGSVVNSVNGQVGDVVLTTSDLENTSDYQTGAQVQSAIAGKQDKLTAGTNIQINNNVISATGTTYSAGSGLNLDGTTFSVDTNTIATVQDVTDEATIRENADTALGNRVTAIEEKIPAQASAQNQLADKDFVNSSVATNTANYISNNGQPFNSLAELEAYSGTLTNNDYAFVVGTDQAGNTTYTRYKYVASTDSWAEEYVLNNSSFTAVQWATINSGITSGDVSKLNNLANIQTIGTNLALTNGELSATDTTYTAGTGLDLTGTQFSIDNATVATQSDLAAGLAGKQDTLTAGANITIDANNVISATGGGSGGVSDVQIAGTSIVNGGVANIDYASASKVGVIRTNTDYGTSVTSVGALISATKTYQQYQDATTPNMFISKGTLENVITGKGLNISSINSGENVNITNLLPNGYTRLEYIGSSGTQYIDPSVASSNTIGININYSYSTINSSTNAGICGIFQGNTPRTDSLLITTVSGKTNGDLFFAHRGAIVYGGHAPTANTIYNVKINWRNSGVLDFEKQTTNVGTNNVESGAIHLFGRKAGSSYTYAVARIYGCQFSDETKMIRNLIPAKRNSDDAIGMYDTVNGVFYENAGTGTFTAGAVLNNIPKINFVNNSGYVTNTDYATSATGGVIRPGASYGTAMASAGILRAVSKTYADYSSAGDYMFVGKGTLENVITGKELDLKQLSTFDRTKTQVLKNVNGTLTWVDE